MGKESPNRQNRKGENGASKAGHGLWGPRGSATSSTYRGARLSGGTGISGKTDRALKQRKRGIGALSNPAWSALPRVAASRLPP